MVITAYSYAPSFCQDKIIFVLDKNIFCPKQNHFCPTQNIFVPDKNFVLSWNNTFLLVKWMENNFLAMEKNCQQLKVIFYPFPKQIWAFKSGTKIFVWDKNVLSGTKNILSRTILILSHSALEWNLVQSQVPKRRLP